MHGLPRHFGRPCTAAMAAILLRPAHIPTTPPATVQPPLRTRSWPRRSYAGKLVVCWASCELSAFHSKPSSRRSVSLGLLLFQCFTFSTPSQAKAGSIFDKYVKRKKLDPLEAYIPVVILTQLQFKDLEKTLEEGNPKYSDCRSLLRSGPASSLRVNIRAVAQYAADDGKGKVANDAVEKCLGALEELDSLFLHASRNDPRATVGSMKEKLVVAVGAIDSLLQTVPSVALDKGKAIADAYFIPSNPSNEGSELGSSNSDSELKELESLL